MSEFNQSEGLLELISEIKSLNQNLLGNSSLFSSYRDLAGVANTPLNASSIFNRISSNNNISQRQASQLQQKQTEAELNTLNQLNKLKLISEGEYQSKKLALQQNSLKANQKLQAEQIRQDKEFALVNASICGVQAVARALSTPPPANIGLAALATAATIAQLAKLNSIKIPAYAQGTNYATGGIALVGEAGPELVNLPIGAQVIPNHSITHTAIDYKQLAQAMSKVQLNIDIVKLNEAMNKYSVQKEKGNW